MDYFVYYLVSNRHLETYSFIFGEIIVMICDCSYIGHTENQEKNYIFFGQLHVLKDIHITWDSLDQNKYKKQFHYLSNF